MIVEISVWRGRSSLIEIDGRCSPTCHSFRPRGNNRRLGLGAISGIAWLAPLFLLSVGCSGKQQATGARFVEASPSPSQALIYFYRPTGESFGYKKTYPIVVNGQQLAEMQHGGCVPYETKPGHLKIVAGAPPASTTQKVLQVALFGPLAFVDTSSWQDPATLELDVQSGEVYFVQFKPEEHMNRFVPKLALVPKSVGQTEIQSCSNAIIAP